MSINMNSWCVSRAKYWSLAASGLVGSLILGCSSRHKALIDLSGQPRGSPTLVREHGKSSCIEREGLLSVAAEPIGPTWPDISKPAPRVSNRTSDAAVIVALEGDAEGPIRIGANGTAQAWSDYFKQTLGVSEQQVHWVSFAGIGQKSVKVAIDAAAKQAGQRGHLWVLFIGRGRFGCTSSSPAGVHCVPQLWLELASAEQRTPEPREWAFEEMQQYVVRRSNSPIVVIDVVAALPPQPSQVAVGEKLQMPQFPAPSRGVTLALVHPVPRVVRNPYAWWPPRWSLKVGDRGDIDVEWPLTLAGSGVLPGTAAPAFSQLLLASLRGWGDRNKDGSVTAEEAVQQIHDALAEAAPTLSGVPVAMGPGRGRALVPVAEKEFPALKSAQPLRVGDRSVLFNAWSRELPAKAGPTANEIDWHMFDDIGDASSLALHLSIGTNPSEFVDSESEYVRSARPQGKYLRESYDKYPDSKIDMRMRRWCATAYFGRLAPFRHEAWRHCGSFVSYASMQLLIESDFERDWQLLDRILRKDTTQAADGLDLLRHILRRYPTVRKSNILETVEATCERMLARGEGEPRLGAVLGTNEWIYVPGMARPTDSVASFEIQRTEITNEQYDQCVQSGSCTKVAYDPTLARDAEVDPNNGTQPVVGVTWDEARAFCRWVGGDLPTIDQWAHAMLASDGSAEDPLAWTRTTEACSSSVIALIGPYPYGQCHPRPKGPASVCSRPLSNTLLGLCDMTGNVSEWVRGDESEARNGKKPRPALGQNWSTGRVGHESEVLPMTTQDGNSRESYIGFRCARKVR